MVTQANALVGVGVGVGVFVVLAGPGPVLRGSRADALLGAGPAARRVP